MQLDEKAAFIIKKLETAGYEAYAVGGCVRDSLLGKKPNDWDICTCALPEETKAVFSAYPVIETGIAHGTVTLVLDHAPYEVTTFRTDGVYSDCRRPDSVRFVDSLREDLARRDFTVNAMAYSPTKGLQDPFHGRADLRDGLIRCVGDPDARFGEDALRLLRALRFASCYGFSIEKGTADALMRNRDLLKKIAVERIAAQFCRLLCGPGAAEILGGFCEVFGVFLPELLPLRGFLQQNSRHDKDVWAHTLSAVQASPPQKNIRLALLMHDIAKPACFTADRKGVGHFYGHAGEGALGAGKILRRLKLDNDTVSRVKTLVRYHDLPLAPNPRLLRRLLHRLGEQAVEELFEVRRADLLAQSPEAAGDLEKLRQAELVLRQILEENQCFSLRDLAVNGRDLMELGYAGCGVGRELRRLLELVMDDSLPNDKAALLSEAGRQRDAAE